MKMSNQWFHCVSFLLLPLLGLFVQGVPVEEAVNSPSITRILKDLERCTADGGLTGVINCAATRALKTVENVNSMSIVEILPGVILSSDESLRQGKKIEIGELPKDPIKKASKLFDLIMDATVRFFSSRTLKIKFPEATSDTVARALEEGRGKMKKMMGPLMLGLGAKMITVIPIMMTGLALMTTKALVIGKLAFVISIILFIQYFFGRGLHFPPVPYYSSFGGGGAYGGYGTSYGAGTYGTNNLGGWGSSQIPYGPYARSIDGVADEQEDTKSAQDLAYSSHTPSQN